MSEVSENVKSEKQWLRGLYMLLFVIISEMAKVVVVTVAIIQFLFAILAGKANSNLTQFGNSMAQFVQQTVNFLTYNTEDKPFPFAQWPEAVVVDEEAEIEFNGSVDAPAVETAEETAEEAVEESAEESVEEVAEVESVVEDTSPDDAADEEEEPKAAGDEAADDQAEEDDSGSKPGS